MQACNLFISVPFAARDVDEPFGDPVRRNASPALKRAYVEAVVREMEGFSEDAEELAIESVTLGTGPTNALSAADLHLMLASAKRLFSIAPETPVYAAFDPGLLSAASLDELRSLGDPRPDFRYLTSDPRESEALGRPDAEAEMRESDALLERVGVRVIGMQVAVGLAGQTKDSLTRTLCDMRRPCVERVELVPLRPESPLALPDDDAAALLRHASEWLSEHGFAPSGPLRFVRGEDNPYFVDRFAPVLTLADRETLSLGPGTASSVGGLAWSNTDDFALYLKRSADETAITERVSAVDEEALALHARLDALHRGEPIAYDPAAHDSLIDEGLLRPVGSEGRRAVELSDKGRLRYLAVFKRLGAASR